MTIDKRLETLTERREALTQGVELLRLEGQEQDKHIDRLTLNVDKVVGVMFSFTQIVQSHERRLTDLEAGS